MSRYRALVIGTALSLKSERASELFAFLKSQETAFTPASDSAKTPSEEWDIVFFLSLDVKPPRPLQDWVDRFKSKKISGRVFVLYTTPLSEAWRAALDPEIEIGDEHALAESIAYLYEASDHAQTVPSDNASPAHAVEEQTLSIQLEPEDSGAKVEFTDTRLEPETSDFEAELAPAATEVDSLSLSLDAADAVDIWEQGVDAEEVKAESALSSHDSLDIYGDLGLDAGPASSEGDDDLAIFSADVSHPDSDISAPLAGRETFNADINLDDLLGSSDQPETHVGPSFHAESAEAADYGSSLEHEPSVDSEVSGEAPADMRTMQKYAALKERDAREKEATIQVLKGQVAKLDTKLSRSEAERRRLSLSNDEMKTQLSTLEESLSQKQFHLQKSDSSHQEELRALSLRLDNAVFQASKAQNKLEEFRERVRTDFVKIRAQERELFNKLELQKRDAEALLASKDEQLLNQKREIDRLQYESETLRERLMEETEKAEERASRLTRAVQSLRLANDMLSGLSEEVLPAASESFGDRNDGEDAA
ncbi:MAG: hypothetical protein ABIR96_12450 [Bdellovibrionota bacterium]